MACSKGSLYTVIVKHLSRLSEGTCGIAINRSLGRAASIVVRYALAAWRHHPTNGSPSGTSAPCHHSPRFFRAALVDGLLDLAC
jgi:hypothetical protein